ncbi:hypothetical protein D0C36_23735 [Mucilaginibacter conchicola]|uniref:Uncharacterized protein n=1 Tax=Mucilaginibacter conchicola TaxID=2303333 RepID=A0A372NLY4_9SPHI|nr:hypothetical protein [Mucilaginibacter conchicola]RFZ89972.1 hypothetical protein D0C36_23735 [Mucilaginibacter conchicola]
MNWPQIVWNVYGLYIWAFRLYIMVALAMSLFLAAPVAGSISYTSNGYHLAIFELEFYIILLLMYQLRPSRFKRVIVKAYTEKSPPPFRKENFFWMVYLGTLLVIFGIPMLIARPYLLAAWRLMDDSNRFIITHAGAWIPALLFLTLISFKLWADLTRSIDDAKYSVTRTLSVLGITVLTALAMYLSLLTFRPEPDVVVVLCLAFNAALLWIDIRLYQKTS